MVLVFGMAFIACKDDSSDGVDPALNGTWVGRGTGGVDVVEVTFNNGSFEFLWDGTTKVRKGTYTASNGSITLTPTDIGGDLVPGPGGDPSEWYSRADIKALGIDDASLDRLFAPLPATYSINGSTLTLAIEGGRITYTKKTS